MSGTLAEEVEFLFLLTLAFGLALGFCLGQFRLQESCTAVCESLGSRAVFVVPGVGLQRQTYMVVRGLLPTLLGSTWRPWLKLVDLDLLGLATRQGGTSC